jgi:UDP-MurNAc hydroxylase
VYVTTLGHSGLKIEGPKGNVLIDPWLSPYGAFQGSWFPFPDNEHLTESTLSDGSVRAVFISHEHLDHLDVWTLSRLPHHVPIFFPRYPSKAVSVKLEAAGPRQLIACSDWEVKEVAGLSLFFVSEASPMNHDAAIVIQENGSALLNLNDARLTPSQIALIRSSIPARVEMVTIQTAGASWHPLCYEMPVWMRRRIAGQKRLAKLAYVRRISRLINPRIVVPFAGPPCFLDQTLDHFNAELSLQDGIFPDQVVAVRWLREHGISSADLSLPGDVWEVPGEKVWRDPTWTSFSFDQKEHYIGTYRGRRREAITCVYDNNPEPTAQLWPAFQEYFDKLLTLSPYFNRRINMRVGFDVAGPGGGQWSVEFRSDRSRVQKSIQGCSYLLRLESRWLTSILAGAMAWEDFLLSLRFSAWREPDIYNDHLLGVLKFADREALRAVELYEMGERSTERITITHAGHAYSVARQCPHAGADLLETGEIDSKRGVLRCLNHYFEFDLETGTCVNGACAPLDIRRVEVSGLGEGEFVAG